ncbi:MAG: ABC transporter permease [Bacteroidota bacterium]|nr:ABC transporter permease [Bacteroidota bacterium]
MLSLSKIPFPIRHIFIEAGRIAQFFYLIIVDGLRPEYEWKEFLKQCFYVGNKSLPLAGVTAFIIGLVLTLQSRPTMQMFGAEAWLPAMVSISIIREIGPVITALICAGKVASGIGAELGSMRVTEQIDAMEVSGISPIKYIVITRVLATTLMLPVLVILSDAISLWGSYIGINMQGNISLRLYVMQVFDNVEYSDIIPSLIKSYFFGFAIGFVGCYKGYYSSKGTEGVGRSANTAVVISSLLIFIIDLLAVQILQILGII